MCKIPERYLQDCPVPLLQGTGNDDLWLWGLAQNDALVACNERLRKARELNDG